MSGPIQATSSRRRHIHESKNSTIDKSQAKMKAQDGKKVAKEQHASKQTVQRAAKHAPKADLGAVPVDYQSSAHEQQSVQPGPSIMQPSSQLPVCESGVSKSANEYPAIAFQSESPDQGQSVDPNAGAPQRGEGYNGKLSGHVVCGGIGFGTKVGVGIPLGPVKAGVNLEVGGSIGYCVDEHGNFSSYHSVSGDGESPVDVSVGGAVGDPKPVQASGFAGVEFTAAGSPKDIHGTGTSVGVSAGEGLVGSVSVGKRTVTVGFGAGVNTGGVDVSVSEKHTEIHQ